MFSTAENTSFGIICLAVACLSAFPLPIHLRAGNTGVILMMFWCFLGLFNKGINALAFNHSLRLHWVIGCDVSAVIERVWQLGLCCSSLCVLQKLEGIASLRQARSTEQERRRRVLLDLSVGLGVPAMQIPLFFIVQPYRLDVVEDLGCNAPIYNSVPAIFVYYLWRMMASMLCAVFAALILRWFVLRRRQFSAALSSQHSGLSQKKYFRLFALAICEAALVSAGQLFLLVESLKITGLSRYSSWADVHANFDTINFIAMAREGPGSQEATMQDVFRWLSLSPAIALFLFFGLTEDAKAAYWSTWRKLQTFFCSAKSGLGRHVSSTADVSQDLAVDLEDLQKVSIELRRDIVIS
uniref:Pheromone receptor a2 n=1 Tax=Macalpinomyces eriachnes TaxID=307738 RepID=H2CZ36_9BASI|nr:pheromone receptor a2 [Macalpinomyces eriachnes]